MPEAKFVQICASRERGRDEPTVFALDENGVVWARVHRGGPTLGWEGWTWLKVPEKRELS
jgi:hypothetical protein